MTVDNQRMNETFFAFARRNRSNKADIFANFKMCFGAFVNEFSLKFTKLLVFEIWEFLGKPLINPNSGRPPPKGV